MTYQTPSLCLPAQEDIQAVVLAFRGPDPKRAAAVINLAFSANFFIDHLPYAIAVGRFLNGVRLVLGDEDAAAMDELRIHGWLPKFARLGQVDLDGNQVMVGVTTQRDAETDLTMRVATLVRGDAAFGLAASVAPTVHDPMSMNHPLIRRSLRRAAVLSPFHLAARA